MTANRNNLNRSIDAATKRTVRQRCGFGCVICGSGIIQYHHFDPPFAEATRHDPSGITLLCGRCHDRAERGIISVAQVSEANLSPWCKQSGYSRDLLFIGDGNIPVRFGSSRVRAATVVMFDDNVIFGLSRPEELRGPLRLNAVITDEGEAELLRIVDSEWQIGIERYDIRTAGDTLTVNDAPGDIVLEMSLAAGAEIQIRRLRMKYRGFSIAADNSSFTLVAPDGATFKHVSDVIADVGIWMKSTGHALIGAGANGGAAVRVGGRMH